MGKTGKLCIIGNFPCDYTEFLNGACWRKNQFAVVCENTVLFCCFVRQIAEKRLFCVDFTDRDGFAGLASLANSV